MTEALIGESIIDEAERAIYEEVPGTDYLSGINLKHDLDVDPEGVIYDIICSAFNKGYRYACKEAMDAIEACEKNMEKEQDRQKFIVVAYVQAVGDDQTPQSHEDCERLVAHLELMSDGETIYKIEAVPPADRELPNDPMNW